MRVVIGFESMYGNTRRIAEAIATAFASSDEVNVAPVNALSDSAADADLLVVGVPTHAHGLPRPGSRRAAVDAAQKKAGRHVVEASATDAGVREWLNAMPLRMPSHVAAFDTRFRLPAWLVGHPARAVLRALARRGATAAAPPESFFVSRNEELLPGELERARQWGDRLRRASETPRMRELSRHSQ